MASANGHLDIVRRLLEARASPDLANDAGNCPLHWACLNGRGRSMKPSARATTRSAKPWPPSPPSKTILSVKRRAKRVKPDLQRRSRNQP
eukprot:symbB.v1.2.027587.t1/scaffold2769.1/size71079/5